MNAPGITKERIIELAGRPEGLRVTWRYRDERLMARCRRLQREGVLRTIKSPPGATVFIKALDTRSC